MKILSFFFIIDYPNSNHLLLPIYMNILSIDGGGIKGLYSAAFLAGLESKYGEKVGNHFDLIVGTSTGGIIALALAAGIPANEIVSFYHEWGKLIFKPSQLSNPKLLIQSKYTNEKLVESLKSVFQEQTLGEIYENNQIAVCIPSIDLTQGKPTVFKTPHSSSLIRDKEYHVWEIALATASAPLFFPIAKIPTPNTKSNNLFMDGGLWANNPSLVGLVEAITYFKKQLSEIQIVSLGNINCMTSIDHKSKLNKGLLSWSTDIVSITLGVQSQSIHEQLELMFRENGLQDCYTRIEHTPNNNSSIKKLDCVTMENLEMLESLGRSRSNNETSNILLKKIFIQEDL